MACLVLLLIMITSIINDDNDNNNNNNNNNNVKSSILMLMLLTVPSELLTRLSHTVRFPAGVGLCSRLIRIICVLPRSGVVY